MRAIIVEDHPVEGRMLTALLEEEGFVVDLVTMAKDAIEVVQSSEYDVMLLDLGLPGKADGLNLIVKMRSSKIHVPILIISGSSDIEERVKGLCFGADDFITKPGNNNEIIARLHAIIRRSKGHSESIVRIGNLTVNLDSKTVSYLNKPVHLTGKEYAILELLALRAGNILTKDMFLDHLYGGRDEPELKIIDVFVCKLRKKLEIASGGKDDLVKTIWGRGYVLEKKKSEKSVALEINENDEHKKGRESEEQQNY